MRTRIVFALLLSLSLLVGVGLPRGRSSASVNPETRLVTLDHGAVDPVVSPDGSQIAVSILGTIWAIPSSGGEAKQITTDAGWFSHPGWSPDGKSLAYAQQLSDGSNLIIRNLATGESNKLYHTEFGLRQITYSPDAKNIFFLLDRNQYDCHLFRIAVGGGEPTQLTFTTNWHEWTFALSPDGKQVLLDSGRYGGSNLYSIQLEGLKSRRLTNTPAHDFSPVWSPDSNAYFYIERDNGIETVIAQHVKGGTARRIFSSPYDEKQLVLDPEGKSAILCAARRLYRLDLDSGKATPILFQARFNLPALAKPDLVIINARVFDAVNNDVRPNSTIEIRDGRIISIKTGQSVAPAGVEVIDAQGKTVLPGLMDNHYHYWSPTTGPLLIARGITSVRDPGVDISSSLNYKDANALSIVNGPDIFTCGPLIDGLNGYHPAVDVELSKPEAAAALVRSLKAQGVDGLKVYFMLNPDVLAAVIKEAKAQGLPVTGHIGVRTGLRQAMESGINGFNHVRVWRDLHDPGKQPDGDNESLDGSKNPIPRMQADWNDIDPDGPQAEALIKMMVDKKIGFDPTLVVQQISDPYRKMLSLDEYSTAQESYKRMSRFVARAYKMGVMILAGTDDSDLFAELEGYSAAGIPNYDVLKTATINGAKWLGKQNDIGTIEQGKRANIIIVDGDPLKDIKDLRKITTVVKDGRIVYKK